jgi:hypothetical protein
VIAFAGGGAMDYVVEGATGTFFHEQTPEALAEAVCSFDAVATDPSIIRAHAVKFDTSVFKTQLWAFVQEALRD